VTERKRVALHLTGVVATAALLVVLLDALTNSLDTVKFSWDFRYYIAMAQRGLVPPLASPFAYRFLTPLLVRIISMELQTPVEAGFDLVARVAAAAQLVGVFLLARWYSRSTRGAWVAMLATAFSLYQVKFLMFDAFRPDHLAYPLILLQVYLALTGRFWPLWIVTIIGCQVREFAAIPLVAWAAASLWDARQSGNQFARSIALRQAVISALGLALALLVPRLLIPIAEDFQFASLTRDGLLRAVLAPLIPIRDVNFIYSLVAYSLPILMLASPRQLLVVAAESRRWDRLFLGTYCVLVLVFSFLGGTDFYRFSSYLLPVMALALAKLTNRSTPAQVMVMLAAVFVFNRIWLPFPQTDLDHYLDFYGASGTHFTLATALRVVELAVLLAVGLLMRTSGSSTGGVTAPSLR
jgi:hypothetical protein